MVKKAAKPMSIDCLDASYINSLKLAKAALAWGKKNKWSTEAILDFIIKDVLGNQLVDDELEENIIVSLAQTFGVPLKNIQHDINGAEEEGDET